MQITFWLTNAYVSEVVIYNVRTSCGCTVAKLPRQPWPVPPGGSGPIDASIDLRGKRGTLTKSVIVDSSSGQKSLLFKVTLAETQSLGDMSDSDRLKNMQLMLADRQIVFKNAACAKCHTEPAQGKLGQPLYEAACGICHDAAHRATMVPDLHIKHPTDADHWRQWITYGRAGSLMPAFAESEGGPLTSQQIESLVTYLTHSIPGKR